MNLGNSSAQEEEQEPSFQMHVSFISHNVRSKHLYGFIDFESSFHVLNLLKTMTFFLFRLTLQLMKNILIEYSVNLGLLRTALSSNSQFQQILQSNAVMGLYFFKMKTQ